MLKTTIWNLNEKSKTLIQPINLNKARTTSFHDSLPLPLLTCPCALWSIHITEHKYLRKLTWQEKQGSSGFGSYKYLLTISSTRGPGNLYNVLHSVHIWRKIPRLQFKKAYTIYHLPCWTVVVKNSTIKSQALQIEWKIKFMVNSSAFTFHHDTTFHNLG